MITVRKAVLADAPMIAGMVCKTHEENGEILSDAIRQNVISGVLDSIMSSDRAFFLAVSEEAKKKKLRKKIIGMTAVVIKIHPIDGLTAVGDYLYIDPKYRRNGVAVKLLSASKEFAESCGAVKAYTEAKIPAIEILREFGFVHESTIMSMKLTPKELKQ